MTIKKILFIEPFYKGSHRYFLDKLKKYSNHSITLKTKNGVFWKWKFLESSLTNALDPDHDYDFIIGSNMLNMAAWAGMNRKAIGHAKLILYFHENQLTYPEDSKKSTNNAFFGFKNLTSCFVADHIFFNSKYHLKSFVRAAKDLSQKLPSSIPQIHFDKLNKNTSVLPIGIETSRFHEHKREVDNEIPILLWNHRWEFDKNPELFLETLIEFKDQGIPFKLIMLGSAPKKLMSIFSKAKTQLADNIIQWGRVSTFKEYADFLYQADILPVTSHHDFFGISVLEAVSCHVRPLLPKRCAYPDHFLVEKYPELYYESDEEYKSKLKDLLLNKTANLDLHSLAKITDQFSWKKVIEQFEAKLEEL